MESGSINNTNMMMGDNKEYLNSPFNNDGRVESESLMLSFVTVNLYQFDITR